MHSAFINQEEKMKLIDKFFDYIKDGHSAITYVKHDDIKKDKHAILAFWKLFKSILQAHTNGLMVIYEKVTYERHAVENQRQRKLAFVNVNVKTYTKNLLHSLRYFNKNDIQYFFHNSRLYIKIGFTLDDEQEGLDPLWVSVMQIAHKFHDSKRLALEYKTGFHRIHETDEGMYISPLQYGPHYSPKYVCAGHLVPALQKNTRDGNILGYYQTVKYSASSLNLDSVFQNPWVKGKIYYMKYQTSTLHLYKIYELMSKKYNLPSFFLPELYKVARKLKSIPTLTFSDAFKLLYPKITSHNDIYDLLITIQRETGMTLEWTLQSIPLAYVRLYKGLKTYMHIPITNFVNLYTAKLINKKDIFKTVLASEKILFFLALVEQTRRTNKKESIFNENIQYYGRDAGKTGLSLKYFSEQRMVWSSMVRFGEEQGWLPNQHYIGLLQASESWTRSMDGMGTAPTSRADTTAG